MKENQDPQKGTVIRPEPIDSPPTSRPQVMDEWMKEMERNIFEITNIKGNLVCKSSFPHVVYGVANSNKITLHGEFTIQQLEALINHMKKYNEKY